MSKCDISVALTFHNEGMIAYRTLLSVQRAIDKLDKDVKTEVIAHIDNGDVVTIDCIRRNQKRFNLTIYENHFGEPAASRNFVAEKANGTFIAFSDGDDLMSDNWLREGYRIILKAKQDCVLHAELDLTFGVDEQPRLWRMSNSKTRDHDDVIMVGRNRWSAGTFLKRSVALKFPYMPATDGFGFEDWHFNSMTLAAGIAHKVIPGTVRFYRMKQNSVYRQHNEDRVVVAYTEEFEFRRMKQLAERLGEKVETPSLPPDNDRMRRYLHYGKKILERLPLVRRMTPALTARVEEKRYQAAMAGFPDFLFEEWRKMSQVDGLLYPNKDVVARMPVYDSEQDYLGLRFCRMYRQLTKEPDYMFMPPELSVGGTEKVLFNYLEALTETHPDWHILVLGKLPENNPYPVPDNVDFLDFDGITSGLADYDKDALLSRLIIQLRVKRLHVMNNAFYYRWVMNHRTLLMKNDYDVYASFFMYEYDPDTQRGLSMADPWLTECYPCLKRIFTDNATVVKRLSEEKGFAPEKFSVHYQPVDYEMIAPKERADGDVVRILWASRIAPQKRPDILAKIAAALPADKYAIDVYGRIQAPCAERSLGKAKALCYRGSFTDIGKVVRDGNYDCYLYTSQTDGIPNILLEVSALGLPIVASRAGGVEDFIQNGKSGRLVEIEDIDGYVRAIEALATDPKAGQKYVRNAQKLLEERHVWEKFIEKVKKDIK